MPYREMWQIEVRHDGLNKYRCIRGTDRHIVEQKAAAQRAAWDETWAKRQGKEKNSDLAAEVTEDAQRAITQLQELLTNALPVSNGLDWESLLDRARFSRPRPIKSSPEIPPAEPDSSDPKYQHKVTFADKLLTGRQERKIREADARYTADHNAWEKRKATIEARNRASNEKYAQAVSDWSKAKASYEEQQQVANARIREQKVRYMRKEVDAVSYYCDMVLRRSEYPKQFPNKWAIEYRPEPQMLLVDYRLPSIDEMPSLKAMRYVASTDQFTEIKLSEAERNRLYDKVLYQVAVRTIHELYEADAAEAIRTINFNGWVESIDKSTGLKVNPCIMSVQASKAEFLALDLSNVDPKACFKHLRGVGSSKLHSIAPVAPIAVINKQDRRFVAPYGVADSLDAAENLAAMDWKDFENLIREIFEQEFASNGGEVKITQASRDGGVDAIAFDPDPIRGGKIVIQAKRYTNTVGVSAVRDLYGTTLNEGATKGILVTTAEYGPDAYKFAQGKPLTLLDGGNLLHLLAKHGHRAKIDLGEAKEILGERKI